MRSSLRRRLLLLTSVFLAAVPVTFGLIRAVSTGDDVRYLWLAGAAILGQVFDRLGWDATVAAIGAALLGAAALALRLGAPAPLRAPLPAPRT